MTAAGVKHEALLAGFLGGLCFDELPDSVVDAAAAVVLDHLICADLGMRQPWVDMLRAHLAEEMGSFTPRKGDRTSVIYGEDMPVPPRVAALVNGTASHSFELDDVYHAALIHPGSCVIPAAIAVGGEADGRDLLTAVVAGYEAIRYLGKAVTTRHSHDGFHSTGVLGPMGAAVAATRMLGGTADMVGHALGIAASFGGGIKAFQNGPGMIKRLHAGRAAEAGILAASLASRGFVGPDEALTGRFGFVDVWSRGAANNPELLTEGLGESFIVANEIYIKRFATCGAIQGTLIAACEVAGALGERVAEIEHLTVGGSRRQIDQNSIAEPRDLMTAQYSLQYCTALALLGLVDDVRRFEDPALYADSSVTRLVRRMTLVLDEQAEEAFAHTNDGRVTVTLKDGSQLSRYGSADPAQHSGLAAVEDKGRRLWASTRSADEQKSVLAGVRALRDGGPIGACFAGLRRPA